MKFKVKNDLNKTLYILVFALQGITILSNIFIYGYVSRTFGEEAFGEFSVYKRFFSFFLTFSILGISVALPRQMIVHDEKKLYYFISSALICFVPYFFLTIIFFSFKEYITLLLFNNLDYSFITELIFISLPFYLYNILIVSYLRGIMKIFESNILIAVTSLCYIFSIVFSENLFNLIFINNLFVLLITLVFHKIYINFSFKEFNLKNIKQPIKKLFNYGFPRIIGDVSFESFSTLPVLILTKSSGIVSAGYLSLGISFLKIIGLLCSPLSNILLPVISKKFKEKNFNDIYSDIKKLLKIFIPFGIISNLLMYLGSSILIYIVLGYENDDAAYIIRFISFISLPILMFYLFRSINDAIYPFAINSIICFISIIIFYLIYLFLIHISFEGTDAILISLVISYFFMAFMSYYFFKTKKIS